MDGSTTLEFWELTGFVGGGHTSYREGELTKEGPFGNPARMVEDLHGEDGEFMGRVWMHAGWWDKAD